MVSWIYNYFKQYSGDVPNPALIRDVQQQAAATGEGKDETDICVETVTRLRKDYGYHHPIEENADKADMAPFLAELNRRGRSKERG